MHGLRHYSLQRPLVSAALCYSSHLVVAACRYLQGPQPVLSSFHPPCISFRKASTLAPSVRALTPLTFTLLFQALRDRNQILSSSRSITLHAPFVGFTMAVVGFAICLSWKPKAFTLLSIVS
ncbi:hypothetical protein E4T43_02316 [Aureobasidium subglaciale]|nr:hypothetical protein E4T43_02316 [Aureobasidium subglaciale]